MYFNLEWRKFANAFKSAAPANSMTAQEAGYIEKRVREATGLGVDCQDTRFVNGRKNVGLIVSHDTPIDKVAQAEAAFISAAADLRIPMKREQIVRYVPGDVQRPAPSR